MTETSDILIIGAGVLGLSVAAELVARGRNVRVVDPGDPNASSVAAGMIAPAFEALLDNADPDRAALLRGAADLWSDFAKRFGIDLDSTPAEWRGPDPEGVAVRLAALGFNPAVSGLAVQASTDRQIEVEPAMAALQQVLGERLTRTLARRVLRSAKGWRIETVLGAVEGGSLVIATGAAEPLPGLPPAVAARIAAIRPIQGQIGWTPESLTDRVLRGRDGYVALGGGGILIGATMVEGRRDLTPDPAASAALVAVAETLLGRRIDGPIAWRAGVRGATADGLPLAGPVEDRLHFALAPRRNGWLMAPLVARIVADGIEGRPRGRHAAALDPLRFSSPEA